MWQGHPVHYRVLNDPEGILYELLWFVMDQKELTDFLRDRLPLPCGPGKKEGIRCLSSRAADGCSDTSL